MSERKVGAIQSMPVDSMSYPMYGWKIREVVKYETLETVSGQVPDPNAGFSGATIAVTEYVKRCCPMVLLEQDVDETIEYLREELTSAKEKNIQLTFNCGELKSEKEKLEIQVNILQQETDDTLAELRKEEARRIDSEELNRRLERDLAKLRKQIGEMEWKRIMNGGIK